MKARDSRTATFTSPWTLALDKAKDENLVGGKAWNLSRMMRHGIPVPHGFVVTDASFQSFLDHHGLRADVESVFADIDPSDLSALRQAADRLQARVGGCGIPDEVYRAVEGAWRGLPGGSTVMVRSSAVGEDSRAASFAGQLESFAGIRSVADLKKAITGCWASCWSPRALHYQCTRGTRIQHMGIVVQAQVEACFAGVLFTRSPDPSARSDEMLVEYCVGHGEELVSGRIDPGRILVQREPFDCRFVASVQQDTTEGGSGELAEEQVRTLHRIGLQLERAFGGPQDIEWAMGPDGSMFIVQARPISASGRAADEGPSEAPDPRRVVWSNVNMNENYPEPVTPFLYSVATDGYYHYFLNLARAFGIGRARLAEMDALLRDTVGAQGGRLYYNLTNIHAAMQSSPFGEHLGDSFDTFVGADQPPPDRSAASAGSPSVPAPDEPVALNRTTFAERMVRTAKRFRFMVKASWKFLFLERRVSAFERTVDAYAKATHPDVLPGQSPDELQAALKAFLDIRCHRWTNASLADAASMIGYGLLKRLVEVTCPDEQQEMQARLLQGMANLVSTQPVSELWRLSRVIREDPELLRSFVDEEEQDIWQRLQEDQRFAAFRRELDAFLEAWGFRCPGEMMMTVESFQEDPRALLPLLKTYVALNGDSPHAKLQRQADERRVATARLYDALTSRRLFRFLPRPTMRPVGRLILTRTHRAIALRERARLKQSLLYSRCRRVVLQLGEVLTARGLIRQPDDAFFLTHQELDRLMSGTILQPDGVPALIDLRRAEQRRQGERTLPETLILRPGEYAAPGAVEATEDRLEPQADVDGLQGTGACGGSITARAMVLTDVAEAGSLQAGDVLVTKQTDPGWAPVFFVVGGLVMERGGVLSHGAIVARECGIPTVVGVADATRRIRTGQRVTVDGDAGYVQCLD